MDKSVNHYLRRSRELGTGGVFHHTWTKIKSEMIAFCQLAWWKWVPNSQMSDRVFLTHVNCVWPSIDSLLDHLAARPASSFILPHESSREILAILTSQYPEHVSAILAAADAACRNELSLLGQEFKFGGEIDWNKDPVTGWKFPKLPQNQMSQYIGAERPVDLIFFWEMNRQQHFITLGIAYWLTDNPKYINAFCRQIQNWIDTNPPRQSINWYYGLEISIRLIAWTVAFQFFRNSPKFREEIGSKFLKSLWQQASFLRNHLQIFRTKDDIPNNHLIAELTGLTLVGLTFSEFRDAHTWRETGLHLLKQYAPVQNHAYGVNKEQAMGYHRFIAELLLLIVTLSHRNALPLQPDLEQMLMRMLDYLSYTLEPIGTVPMWGDSDYGRVLGLGKNKNFWDIRWLLSAGAALFGRVDWKFTAGRFDEEAFWLLGMEGLEAWEKLDAHAPTQTSNAFPQGGVYIIRDDWTANTDVAFFRCGPFGLGGAGHCAHAHCDLLSFTLWVNGQPLLVDSGTYTYHGSFRNYFRLASAHNTAMIDGHEQAIPLPNFNWEQTPNAENMEWDGKRVKGLLAFPGQLSFMRELIHPKHGVWNSIDTFTGKDEHNIEWFFHFNPSLDLELDDKRCKLIVKQQGQPFVILSMPDNHVHFQLRDSWYSEKYGIKQCNRELYGHWQGILKPNGVTFNWQFQLINQSSSQ